MQPSHVKTVYSIKKMENNQTRRMDAVHCAHDTCIIKRYIKTSEAD